MATEKYYVPESSPWPLAASVGLFLTAVGGANFIQQATDPDLKKFVEIVGHNREELHPLEKRIVRIAGFVQDAFVEREPGKLSVCVVTRIP